MKTVCDLNKCNGCMACTSVCPQNCITIMDDIFTFNAKIDELLCVNCNRCKQVCSNIGNHKTANPIEWKQGWANNSVRESSTSGGVASAIIRTFIQLGGYVAACLFKNGEFIFELTNDLEVAKRFAGSKYVKSNPTGIYEKIKNKLKTDDVLFIGLPCQVAAIKKYVKSNRLYTIDIICHGTPSVKLLSQFISEKGYELNNINDIKFRNKLDMGISIDDNRLYSRRVMDEYICAFLEGVDYTENCYSCQFASLNRISDVTLGDSWGTEYKDEEKKGISLILIQSDRGRNLVKECKLELKDVDLNIAISNNQQLSSPSQLPKKREKFLNMIENGESFKKVTFSCLPYLVLKQKIKYVMIKLHLLK